MLNIKGQLISKCPCCRKTSSKKPTKNFWISALNFFSSFLGASWKLFGLPGDIVSNIINKEPYRKPPKASRKPQGSYKKFQGRNSEIFRWFFERSFLTKILQEDMLKLTDLYKQRFCKNFSQLLEEDAIDNPNAPNYLSAQTPASTKPKRHLCSVCLYPIHIAHPVE
jgi:hypothetical protein